MQPHQKYENMGRYYECIVVKQPYAELMRMGQKTVELRSEYPEVVPDGTQVLIISEKNTSVNGLPVRRVIARGKVKKVEKTQEKHRKPARVFNDKPIYGYAIVFEKLVPIKPVPARVLPDAVMFALWFY